MVNKNSKKIILKILSENDKVTPTEIEKKCQERKDGISKGTIFKTLKELLEEHHIQKEVIGRNVFYSMIDKNEQAKILAVKNLEESFHRKLSNELIVKLIDQFASLYSVSIEKDLIKDFEISNKSIEMDFLKKYIGECLKKIMLYNSGLEILFSSNSKVIHDLWEKNSLDLTNEYAQILLQLLSLATLIGLQSHIKKIESNEKLPIPTTYQLIFRYTPTIIDLNDAYENVLENFLLIEQDKKERTRIFEIIDAYQSNAEEFNKLIKLKTKLRKDFYEKYVIDAFGKSVYSIRTLVDLSKQMKGKKK